jgi:hypothetical protein
VPLAQVRDLLGHASITTTERYDNQTIEALSMAVTRLESGKRFDLLMPRAGARSLARSAAVSEGAERPAAALIAYPGAEAPGLHQEGTARAIDHLDARTSSTARTNAADTTQDGRNAAASEADCRILSSFFQDRVDESRKGPQEAPSSATAKSLETEDLESWYRYGDSNPGPVAENHVS